MAEGEETAVPVEPTPEPVKKSALADLFAGFGDLKPTAGVAPAQALAQITPEEAGIEPSEEDDEDEDGEEDEDEPGDDEGEDEDEDEEEEEAEPALADVLDEVMKGLKKERKAIRQLGGLEEPLRARLMSVLEILVKGFDTLADEAAAAEEEHEQHGQAPQLAAGAGAPEGFNAVGVQSALLGAVSLPPFLLKNERAWKQYLAACPATDRKILTEMVDKIPTLVMQAVEHIAQVTGVAPQQAIEAAGIPFAALQEEVDRQQAAPPQREPGPQSKRGRKGRGR